MGKPMRCIRLLFTLALVWVLLVSIGYPAAVLGGGGAAPGVSPMAYVKGELRSIEEVPLNRAWKGTQMAMDDLEFRTTVKERMPSDAEAIANPVSGKKITGALKKIADTSTEIRILIGTFGDKSLSRQILERKKNEPQSERSVH